MDPVHLDILPPAQRRLWDELGSLPDGFVLYGGTALALYLGHRQSVDFDFFLDRSLDADALLAGLPFLQGAALIARTPETLICRVERGGPVQVAFFGVPKLPRLAPPRRLENGVALASLLDLAGTKAAVVQKRSEAKDYLDLDALLQLTDLTLPLALEAAGRLYGGAFSPISTLKALCYYGDGDLETVPPEVRQRLKRAVANIG